MQFGTHCLLISLIIWTTCFYLVFNAASKRISTNFHLRHKRCPHPRWVSLYWHMAHHQLHGWWVGRSVGAILIDWCSLISDILLNVADPWIKPADSGREYVPLCMWSDTDWPVTYTAKQPSLWELWLRRHCGTSQRSPGVCHSQSWSWILSGCTAQQCHLIASVINRFIALHS